MHRIAAAGLQAKISDLGAELQSLTLTDGTELMWQGDPAWWSGRSPVLFPIVGRAPEDRLTLGGVPLQMSQHGFARRSVFTPVAQGGDFIRHQLTDSPETRAQYPRAFRLTLEHRLSEAGLTLSVEVENPGPLPLPYQLGLHPAFRWPLPGTDGAPHRIRLQNRAEPPRRPLRGGLIAEGHLPSPFRDGILTLAPELFHDDALIFPEGAGTVLCYGPDDGPHLEITSQNLPSLALWTKPGAGFLCIEPWQGMAARQDGGPALEARPGALRLGPGESRRFALTVTPRGFAAHP